MHLAGNPKILYRHVKAANVLLDAKIVYSDLDKHIVSYQPKVETADSHEFNREKSTPMDRALEIQANLASKFPSFVKNMLSSHVAGGLWLGLPKKFSEMHLSKDDTTFVLVDETELEHETKYFAQKNWLSGGWRRFFIDHKLRENDVLVFHSIQDCKFKVHIVRANALSEIDGAISLLNLAACVTKMDSEGPKITVMAQEEHLKQYSPVHSVQEKDMVALTTNVDTAADNSGSDDFDGISIADAIRSSKPSKCEDLKAWDSSLQAFEILGMKVGFLRARINKLLILSSDLEDALKRKIVEKAKAEEELKVLEIKA
ncbi:hypothetical protein ACET3Z_030543 [Daucus carota]